jgi:hypothetical protein
LLEVCKKTASKFLACNESASTHKKQVSDIAITINKAIGYVVFSNARLIGVGAKALELCSSRNPATLQFSGLLVRSKTGNFLA